MNSNNIKNENERMNEIEESVKPYIDYANGKITLDECFNILLERGDLSNSLSKDFEEKLDKEFNELCEGLQQKTPKEIIDRDYEITVKEEIKEELKYMDLHDKEKFIMFGQKNLLDEFYHDWLDTDVPLGDVLEDTLEESIANMTRYANRKIDFENLER